MANRDNSIDILRAFALIGMIISHCNPGPVMMQLRGFDVPLIVFLSGVSYVISRNNKIGNSNYLQYCWKRFKRLVFPTWLFLFIYYAILFIGLSITGNRIINWTEIVRNFTLTTGWYVWIIRVFFVIALFAPLLFKITSNIGTRLFCVLFVGILVIYENVACITDNEAYYYITMTIPYLMMFMYGTMTQRLSNKNILVFSAVAFISYLIFTAYYYHSTGEIQITQIKKYPPQLFYMSYAIAFTSVLWVTRYRIEQLFNSLRISSFFSFVGSHTLWIYFWHIIILLLLGTKVHNTVGLFFLVLALSVAVDYVQVLSVNLLIRKTDNVAIKRNMSLLFLG